MSRDPRGNPGSEEAREKGCVCPVMDNNQGKWAPVPPDGWWMRADCPMHGNSYAVEERPGIGGAL